MCLGSWYSRRLSTARRALGLQDPISMQEVEDLCPANVPERTRKGTAL